MAGLVVVVLGSPGSPNFEPKAEPPHLGRVSCHLKRVTPHPAVLFVGTKPRNELGSPAEPSAERSCGGYGSGSP